MKRAGVARSASSPSDSDLRRHVILRNEGLGINNGTAGTGRLVEIRGSVRVMMRVKGGEGMNQDIIGLQGRAGGQMRR